jgi:tripartite-type tricarboxylate transporter receptor subunit TctC
MAILRSLGMVLAIALLSFAPAARAQDYPARTIRILVPFAAGGAVDTSARILSQKLTERLGWKLVVENRPGGNGFIATTAAARAKPDGYTLLMAHTGEFAVNPALFAAIPYELERDFTAITMVTDAPLLYLANRAAPFDTLQELITAAKREPGTISISSGGTGSINHLAGEWLALAAGIRLLHVPFKGGTPAAAAVAAGEVQLGVASIPAAAPHLQAGRVKVLAVTTAQRSRLDASWPTAREAGVADVDVSVWSGLFAPKGVAPAIVERLNAEVRRTLDAPDVRALLAAQGFDAAGMSPAEFLVRIRRDAERYRTVIGAAGIRLE